MRKLSRQLQKAHEGRLAQNITRNPKVFWKYVRSKLKTRVSVEELRKEGGTRSRSNEEEAEALNQFFSAVFTVENQDIPDVDFRFERECLTDIHISQEEVRKRLETLDITKSPGPD